MENTAKTDNFLRAIKKYADRQRRQMREEIEQIKEKKIAEAEKKAKLDSEKLIKDRHESKRNEQTSLLAKLTQEGQRKLFIERAEMTEKVFEAACEKLSDFSDTPRYKAMLINSAKEIAALFENKDCVVFVSEKDISLAEEIKAVFGDNTEIIADRDIKLGGIRGYCEALRIEADETLDSKLEAQREWFIKNSGLSVL